MGLRGKDATCRLHTSIASNARRGGHVTHRLDPGRLRIVAHDINDLTRCVVEDLDHDLWLINH